MKHTSLAIVIIEIFCALVLFSPDVNAERRRRRPRPEVVAWSSDASIVIFAEPRPRSRNRMDLVARRVPSGEQITRVGVFPGQCAREIEGRVAIAHACALAEIRPRLSSQLRRLRYHIAANERGRIGRITLRADGSIVEHEIPQLGLVLRSRLEEDRDERFFAVLEVSELDDDNGRTRILDRRPMRPRSRRRWTLLQAGDQHLIVVARGVLRRINRAN